MAGRRIGGVLAELQQDFPDLSISKIRFLEAEGLLEPQRSGAGYRSYSAADVERLRFILTAQRDRFWPLKVIREALDAMERGLTVDADAGSPTPQPPQVEPDPDLPDATALVQSSTARLSRRELATSGGASLNLIDELVSYGLLRPDAAGFFTGESARIATTAAQLSELGIEARHLRLFRTAAEREVGLVDYAAARAADPDPAQVALACLGLHTALVKDELARRS